VIFRTSIKTAEFFCSFCLSIRAAGSFARASVMIGAHSLAFVGNLKDKQVRNFLCSFSNNQSSLCGPCCCQQSWGWLTRRFGSVESRNLISCKQQFDQLRNE
jgi:hypothetical protein